jgi:dipeptidyl-peptidase-4
MWQRASPAAQVGTIKAPVLMIGGANDEIVHVGQTYTMAAELQRAQKEFELVMYPNEEHGLKQLPHQLDSIQRVLDFLDRYLKN